MHIGPVAALIRQWPVIPGSFHRPGRHSISVPTFGGWSTDAGRSPDSRWTHQAWAALSPSERKPWEYPGLPRLQPETGGVAGVELATASEPPARQPRIWGRRPSGVDPSHP